MSTHKNIDRICIIAVIFSLILSTLLINSEAVGIQEMTKIMGYESRLFDTSRVHTIDIVMDDWESFIETCENEEYAECAAVIDGESYKNIAIRAKGNTSLSSVSSMESDRYSFKVEFDHYDSNKTYHGLDKLSLNNIIQDNTFMKDYLTYRMMYEFDVSAPLCSFAYITVNGKDWGLYLAVEGIEDSFLQRNYGSDSGELYKPDSMSFGGGRGNGNKFNMDDFLNSEENTDTRSTTAENFNPDNLPEGGMTMPESFDPSNLPEGGMTMPESFDPSNLPEGGMTMPENFDPSNQPEGEKTMPQGFDKGNISDRRNGGFDKGGMGGNGSSDVKLKYTDDNPQSYSNIFDNAKTDITDEDKTRLISSLKALSENYDIENVVDIESVIRYFVVHNFVCNGDSYTGSMIHNYYLYEKDGKLSMIPWDYNLAYGTFEGGNAVSQINFPIDSPVSGGNISDRPMISWIFENDEYTALYHELFSEFLSEISITSIIDEAAEIIAPYL